MKLQPNRNYNSNDIVMTPEKLCEKIVSHFKPNGIILEPCKGTGNFLKYIPNALWCEISEGKDFFEFHGKVDWIVTNPPWSKIRKFLQHGMEVSNNIIFLFTINHLFTKARIRDIRENGFCIKEIRTIDTPKEFPQSGFQLGVVHLTKGEQENIIFGEL